MLLAVRLTMVSAAERRFQHHVCCRHTLPCDDCDEGVVGLLRYVLSWTTTGVSHAMSVHGGLICTTWCGRVVNGGAESD